MNCIYKVFLTSLTIGALSFGLSGCQNDDNSSTSNQDEKYGQFNAEVFNEFKSGSLLYKADLNNFTSSGNYDSQVELKISEGRYHFKEMINGNIMKNGEIKIFRTTDGYSCIKEIDINNEVIEKYLYFQNNQQVRFNDYYLNPFQYIEFEDLNYSPTLKTYTFDNKESLDKFYKSISYYGEDLLKFNLKYNTIDNNFEVYYEAKTSSYEVVGNGIIFLTDQEVEDVVAYRHLDYHDEIKVALDELDNVNNFTYNVTRIDLNEKHPQQNLITLYTDDVIMYPIDSFTGYVNQYGVAKFNDGSIRHFEVVNDKVVPGYKDEFDRPKFNVCAVELYQKVDENIYQIDSLEIGKTIAMNMANTYDEETLIEYFGINSNFKIEVKDGHLKAFSYVVQRVYSDYIVSNELCVVSISDVNKTKIDDNLVFEVNDEATTKPKYIGTWQGENRIGDMKNHTLVIQENDNITLDGKAVSDIYFDPTDGYSFKCDGLSYVAVLTAEENLFIYDVASSYLNIIATKS